MVSAKSGKDDDAFRTLARATELPVENVEPSRLSPEEVAEALLAAEEAQSLRDAILARRNGRPMPDSAGLIRQQRALRSKRL
jgi:hypothetical protein